jgi:hypothetical protein
MCHGRLHAKKIKTALSTDFVKRLYLHLPAEMLDYYGEGVGFIYELDTLYMVANSLTLTVVDPVTHERIKIGNVWPDPELPLRGYYVSVSKQ